MSAPPPAPESRDVPWREGLLRFGGLFSLAVGVAGATAIMRAFSLGGRSNTAIARFKEGLVRCDVPSSEKVAGLRSYVAESNWVGVSVLEAVVAAIALGCAMGAIAANGGKVRRRWEWWLVLALGAAAVAFNIHEVNKIAAIGSAPEGFLSDLLSTLPDGCAAVVRGSIRRARLIGESTGICVGVAMCTVLVFPNRPDAFELARRTTWIQRLLYVSSLLFVVGIMMSRANFTWVLAHWDSSDEKLSKALDDVVHVGVVQCGVGYSALLVAFFLPARAILGSLVGPLIPLEVRVDAEARQKWLVTHGLHGSWQDEARQILALLAPVLSAPVFDAIAKIGG
jgi:hypothetical protein